MEKYYNIDYTKQKLQEYLDNGCEPELCIKIDGENYMIIPLKDKLSFQWIGKSDEYFYSNIDALFNKNLVNGINLNNDWNKIEEIWYC